MFKHWLLLELSLYEPALALYKKCQPHMCVSRVIEIRTHARHMGVFVVYTFMTCGRNGRTIAMVHMNESMKVAPDYYSSTTY